MIPTVKCNNRVTPRDTFILYKIYALHNSILTDIIILKFIIVDYNPFLTKIQAVNASVSHVLELLYTIDGLLLFALLWIIKATILESNIVAQSPKFEIFLKIQFLVAMVTNIYVFMKFTTRCCVIHH